MSHANGNAHLVTLYESGKTKPLSGERLASFNWKTGTDKNSLWFGIKRESKAVSLPPIGSETITENLTVLMPHLKNYLHGVQDKIIREILDKNPDCTQIVGSDVSIGSIVEYLEDSTDSGRVTKEDAKNWFNEQIADNLSLALAAKLGVGDSPSEEDAAKVEAVVEAFRTKISSLAGGKTVYDAGTAKQLQKAIALVPSGDILGDRFMSRLQKMVEVPKDSLLDAL